VPLSFYSKDRIMGDMLRIVAKNNMRLFFFVAAALLVLAVLMSCTLHALISHPDIPFVTACLSASATNIIGSTGVRNMALWAGVGAILFLVFASILNAVKGKENLLVYGGVSARFVLNRTGNRRNYSTEYFRMHIDCLIC